MGRILLTPAADLAKLICMYRPAVLLCACITVVAQLFAQVPPFGAPAPLTGTRYETASGDPLLRSDGQNAFLFWMDSQLEEQRRGQLRVTRIDAGERGVGRPVFDTPIGTVRVRHDFDAVWTGTHFVVAAAVEGRIMGRIVTAAGNPSGEPFVIAEEGWSPRMAFNGTHILIVYEGQQDYSRLLTADGKPVTEPAYVFPGAILQESPAMASDGKRFAAIVSTQIGPRLLIFDENGHRGAEIVLSDSRSWSIASDGTRYLLVSNDGAQLFDANGTAAGGTLQLPDTTFARRIATVWTGTTWGISYVLGGQLRVLDLDAEARSIRSQETIQAVTGTIIAMNAKIVASWNAAGGIYVATRPQPVSVAASRQWLVATATSATGTLVVWEEMGNGRSVIRAGVRGRDGSWRESEITASTILWPEYLPSPAALAASDGSGFLVSIRQTLFALDANGARLSTQLLPDSLRPMDIAWDGTHYGLVGVDSSNQLRTALLSPRGELLRIGSIPFGGNQYASVAMIASNGDGFYVTWHRFDCYEYPCGPTELTGIALDSSLGLLDSVPRGFAPGNLRSVASLGTNGRRYVLAYSTSRGIVAAHVSPAGVEETVISPEQGRGISVTRMGDRAAIGWIHDDYSTYPYVAEYRVATIDDHLQVSSPVTLERDSTTVLGSAIEAYPDGTLLSLRSSFQTGAPYHGSSRLMMRVGSFALPQRADAPRLNAQTDHGTAHLEWTAPAGDVDGYRVEVRIGDGLWNEIDSLLDASRRTLDVTLSQPAAMTMFRVRAFNDAGPGAYSAPVVVNPAKRRSAR
jgi:hypothetical protein